jgi:hypothetical protein
VGSVWVLCYSSKLSRYLLTWDYQLIWFWGTYRFWIKCITCSEYSKNWSVYACIKFETHKWTYFFILKVFILLDSRPFCDMR